MTLLVDYVKGDDVRRFFAHSLADLHDLLKTDPTDKEDNFFLRVERLPTIGTTKGVSS